MHPALPLVLAAGLCAAAACHHDHARRAATGGGPPSAASAGGARAETPDPEPDFRGQPRRGSSGSASVGGW